MTSKEQAKLIGDALLAAAEADRVRAAERNTRTSVRIYPALKQVPPLERYEALRDARDFSADYVGSRFLLVAISLALAALVALSLTGHIRLAVAAGWLAALLSIGRQFFELVLIRRYLARRFARAPGDTHNS